MSDIPEGSNFGIPPNEEPAEEKGEPDNDASEAADTES